MADRPHAVAGRALDAARFEGAIPLVCDELPDPAVEPHRPGIAVLILHQGRTGDYAVLGWWDNENELPLRVFVREGDGWRPARGGESICVWDMEVLWAERNDYVTRVLTKRPQVHVYAEESAVLEL